jgi:transposase InsO family protein
LISGFVPCCAEQVWVSDITYITINGPPDFVYLALITDLYSHQIMGFHLSQRLRAKMCLAALRMALRQRQYPEHLLIHHSDRGVQYCCGDYVEDLQKAQIHISMTQNGSPYENPVAERVNGILKQELGLNQIFESYAQAVNAAAQAVYKYNHLRPHASCNYLTPVQAHQQQGSLPKRW